MLLLLVVVDQDIQAGYRMNVVLSALCLLSCGPVIFTSAKLQIVPGPRLWFGRARCTREILLLVQRAASTFFLEKLVAPRIS
jgi:hypothetical protein